jgi:hypothetical protein
MTPRGGRRYACRNPDRSGNGQYPTVQDERLERLVTPFYLRMMRLNAVEHGDSLVAELAAAGDQATSDEVTWLLRSFWRERVAGAWLSLRHDDDPAVTAAVLEALRTSQGSLDAPPLATAAVVLAGSDALDALRQYVMADLAADWGAANFVAAAIRHVADHVPGVPEPSVDAGTWFGQLLRVAGAIQSRPR